MSSARNLIRLDTRSIRTKAIHAHRQAERSLTQLKDQLKRYHDKDIPGFRSWAHRTFGHLLTRQRELQHAIEEKQAFIFELQWVASHYGLTDLAAYRKVLWRRAHPDEAQAEDQQLEEAERQRRAVHPDDDAFGDPFGDDDPEADNIFGDDGFDPMADDDRDRFDDFFETITGNRPPPRDSSRPHPDQKSVKELYRTIVRQLHPDHHGQMTETRKALWHEAQEAYRRHDVNALYNILARCETGEAGLGEHSPVSLIRRMTQQLKRAAQTIRGDIRKMRRDAAWDYEQRVKSPVFVRQVRQDLEGMVQELQWTLDEITRELGRLDRLAKRSAQQTRPPQKKPNPLRRSNLQDEFLF